MVRINLINPKELSDQHLVAEYNEILMLLGYVRKYPLLGKIPSEYTLGKGHILFFKNKLLYLQKRHRSIVKEMKIRDFNPTKDVDLSFYPAELCRDWRPKQKDFEVILNRISWKIASKPGWYRYYHKPIKNGKIKK